MRISNSFSEGEIQVLEFVLQSLLRGGSPSMAARHKDFPSLCRKIMAMKARVGTKVESKSDQQLAESKASTLPSIAESSSNVSLQHAV